MRILERSLDDLPAVTGRDLRTHFVVGHIAVPFVPGGGSGPKRKGAEQGDEKHGDFHGESQVAMAWQSLQFARLFSRLDVARGLPVLARGFVS